METYNEKFDSNPGVELVQISFDRDEDSAKAWAEKENLPWPTIMQDDVDEDELITKFFPDGRIGLPSYVLVDLNGKEVARGKAAAMAAIEKSAK